MSSRQHSCDGSACSQESVHSDGESQNSSRIQGKPKQVDMRFTCWKFRDTIQADFPEGSFDDRRQKLIEHFRTRTSSGMPPCVRSVTIFADLDQLVFDATHETRSISITIIGYIQTKQSRTSTMTSWIRDAKWEPISGGLCSNYEFLQYVEYANNPSKSWFELPIFGELGLNNQGRLAARIDRKVCVICFHLNF